MALPWHIPLEFANHKKDNMKAKDPQPTLFKHLCKLDVHANPCEEVQTGLMCEIGLSNREPATIQRLIAAGMTVARLNLYDLEPDACSQLVQSVRQAVYNYSAELDYVYPLAVIVDVKGPEIVTGELKGGPKTTIDLVQLETIRLTTDASWRESGTLDCLFVGYDHLTELRAGDTIFIDSLTTGAKVKLTVSEVGDDCVECLVAIGGTIGSKMTVRISQAPRDVVSNVKQDSVESMTCSDLSEQRMELVEEQIAWAVGSDVDGILVPNTLAAQDIQSVREILSEKGQHILVFACIDSVMGLNNIDTILDAADGIYLDRCVLTTDLPVEKIFIAQKTIVAKCNAFGKSCICKAVINEQIPTLCVTDIANLVLDGVDVISLEMHFDSPLKKISAVYDSVKMAEHCIAAAAVICKHAEMIIWQPIVYGNVELMQSYLEEPTKALSICAVELATRARAVVIICLTNSGRTAKLISHAKPFCPIVAVTRVCHTARQLRFWRGLRAMHYFDVPIPNRAAEVDARIRAGLDYCKAKHLINTGDAYVVVTGSRHGVGYCDSVRLLYASCRNSIEVE